MTSQLVIFRAFFFFSSPTLTLNLKKKSRKSTNKKFWPKFLDQRYMDTTLCQSSEAWLNLGNLLISSKATMFLNKFLVEK